MPDAMRRAFTQVKNGRPRPVMVEIPVDVMRAEIPDDFVYTPAPRLRMAPDPQSVTALAAELVAANRLVIYAGQGVHYARAWKQLRELAELLEAPVTTSLQGKSAFPENHPLSLGSGGRSISKQLHHFLNNADLIFGIGCSFTSTNYGVAMPKGKRIAHATLDPLDINKDIVADIAAGRRRRAHARRADRRGEGPAEGQAAGPDGRRHEGNRHAEAGVAGAVDAAAHAEDVAAVALSRAVGPDAHGGRGQHHHHPRRRQPARPDLALLGADRRR